MKNKLSFSLLIPLVFITILSACGGGGGSSSSEVEPCNVLRIAGGQSCESPPRSIAIVATDTGYCTGTFITTRHVLTAAHCFVTDRDRVLVAVPGTSYNVRSYTVHPQYDGSIDSPFDVAVVTLASPADVTPVPLKLSEGVRSGDRVVIYGYGVDQDDRDVIRRVQEGGVPLKATRLNVVGVSPGTILSRSDGSGDTCQGDSGGALLFTGSSGQPGIVALVRAGPPGCRIDPGRPSENSEIQAQRVLDFIFSAAPGTLVN